MAFHRSSPAERTALPPVSRNASVALFRDPEGLRRRQTHSRRSIFADRKTQSSREVRGCSGSADGSAGCSHAGELPIGPPSQQVSRIMPHCRHMSFARISNVSPWQTGQRGWLMGAECNWRAGLVGQASACRCSTRPIRLGVAPTISPAARLRPPGYGPLGCACAAPSMASLVTYAVSMVGATPSLPVRKPEAQARECERGNRCLPRLRFGLPLGVTRRGSRRVPSGRGRRGRGSARCRRCGSDR